MSTKKRIHVVVGIIPEGELVCIARRAKDAHLGGLWEFPGGKVEAGETAFEGLQRELFEEIGIKVLSARPIMQLPHDYSEREVLLDFWLVKEFQGKAHGKEGQLVIWVKRNELMLYTFPEANRPIKEMLVQGEL